MSSISFDTLAYAKKLIAAGVPAQQAEIQAETFAEIIEERLATKQDIRDLEVKLKEMEYRMIIKLGAMLVVTSTLVIGVLKFLHYPNHLK